MLQAQSCRKSQNPTLGIDCKIFFSNQMPKGTLWRERCLRQLLPSGFSVYVSQRDTEPTAMGQISDKSAACLLLQGSRVRPWVCLHSTLSKELLTE